MCGIAGIIGRQSDQIPNLVSAMLTSMNHRGPDAASVQSFCFNNLENSTAVIGHNRLKIIDPSSEANQPMQAQFSNNKKMILSFNGEIYNYQQLKKILPATNYQSASDTEVLLNAYLHWGESAIPKLNGMFAFAVADEQAQKILLVRDRLGIKPLYYARLIGGGIAFASEIKGLLALPETLISREMNPSALSSFLAQGYISQCDSPFQSVQMLEAGHTLEINPEGEIIEDRQYWSIYDTTPDETFDIQETFKSAVQLRLNSDVPLAVFLSSGMDSALLAKYAFELSGNTLETITVGFPDVPSFDESTVANQISKDIGSKNHCLNLSNTELVDSFNGFLSSMDSPTSDGFNTYTICQATRALGFQVALSGLGADELFAGYASFKQIPDIMKFAAFQSPIQMMTHLIPNKFIQGSRALAKIHALSERPFDLINLYFLRRELFLPEIRRKLLTNKPENCDKNIGLPTRYLESLLTKNHDSNVDIINKISQLEISTYMRNMLLRDNDCYSMAHSMELRVPFLDHRLVEGMLGIKGNQKISGPGLKPLMQKTFAKQLPKSAERHQKKGFAFPWSHWLKGPLKEMTANAIYDKNGWEAIGVNHLEIQKTWKSFLDGHASTSPTQIVALLCLHHYREKAGLRL